MDALAFLLELLSQPQIIIYRTITFLLWYRYQESYERKLDPFSNFSKQEKQRKYGQLSVFEKVVRNLFLPSVIWKCNDRQVILSLVRFIMSNKTARLVVFFYSVLLHGLVFAVLYKLVLTESCRQTVVKSGCFLWQDIFFSGTTWPPSGMRSMLSTWKASTMVKNTQDECLKN